MNMSPSTRLANFRWRNDEGRETESHSPSPPDDPLGIDPGKDFNKEARRVARDAIEGRHQEAIRVEVEAAPHRWGITPKAALIAMAKEILDRVPDADPDPADEVLTLIHRPCQT